MKLTKWIVSSLRTKLLIMFVLLTVIPLILVGVISYVKSIHIISENANSFAKVQANEVSQEIDVIFQDVKRFTEIGKQESTIQFLINQDNTQEEAKTILNMFSFYREIYQSSKYIRSISIFNLEGKVISERYGVHQLEKIPSKNPDYKMLLNQKEETLIQPTVHNGLPVISITSSVISEVTDDVIGFINIIVDASAIKDILKKDSLGDTGSFHIETGFGESVFFSSKGDAGRFFISDWNSIRKKDSGVVTNASETVVTVFDTVETTGWKVIGQAHTDEIMRDANEIRRLIILTVACSIIFTITLYFFISNKLIRPIRLLKQKMSLASLGNLDVKVVNESADEIADLGNSFNSMIAKIKSLLQKSVEEQKQLTKAEFRALQSQINPHFLYNTLDNIIWMAEAKKSTEVIEMTNALSYFFRITLSGGKDWITIREEMEHIRNYLIIQKIRYRDILDVSFHINEEILHYKVLKLTLQPLVENAIYHGIKNKRGKGLIIIKGDFDWNGNICIQIIDNGIGIKEDRLAEIRQQLSLGVPPKRESGGFGMYNVQQRIELYYGRPFGLTINSHYQEGAIICLTIPAEVDCDEKIFLLDDEVQVREGIKNSINWKNEGFVYCGDASDGEIALPLVEKYQPDIVITDIKMPFMDGLEFSRILREKMPAVKIIILSGHDEFEYAREALRVQITEYCLKPISAIELLKILHKVSHQIDEELLAQNQLTELQHLASQSKSITQETFLHDLCQGIYSPSEAINKATHLGIDLVSSYYYILIIEAKEAIDIDSMNWITDQYSCLHFKLNPKEMVFIMKGDSKSRLEHEARVLREKCLTIREQNIESPLIFGFGKVQSRMQGIAVSFLDAEEEKNYHKIIHKHKQVDNDKKVSANHEVFLSNRNELLEFLKNGDVDSITDFSKRYTLFLQEANNSAPFFIYYSLLDFTISIKQYIKEMGMENAELLQGINNIEMRAGWIREYSEVDRYITEMLLTVFKSAAQSKFPYNPVIQIAMEYIQSQFHDTQLSLQSIANRVNVSPSYFSHMFSQETGQTLVEYITNIRMEHAKRLLKSTNEKTYEIAQKVGYNDSHYFCNLFKKLTGMTTRQFKLRG